MTKHWSWCRTLDNLRQWRFDHGPILLRRVNPARPNSRSLRRIGSALLERSLLAARNRGIKRLEVCCLMENQRMQQLARKFEAELTFDFGTVIGKMENPHPTPLSVMQEMAVDGHSFAAAYVDFQSRLLRPMGALVRLPQPCPLQVHS